MPSAGPKNAEDSPKEFLVEFVSTQNQLLRKTKTKRNKRFRKNSDSYHVRKPFIDTDRRVRSLQGHLLRPECLRPWLFRSFPSPQRPRKISQWTACPSPMRRLSKIYERYCERAPILTVFVIKMQTDDFGKENCVARIRLLTMKVNEMRDVHIFFFWWSFGLLSD